MNDNTQMPTMPTAPVQTETVQAPVMPTAPVHEEVEIQKPKMQTTNMSVSNSLEIPTPRGGIEVVALRKGFYNQNRIKPGQKFKVANFENLGSWMQCSDSEMEKRKLEFFKNKKASR